MPNKPFLLWNIYFLLSKRHLILDNSFTTNVCYCINGIQLTIVDYDDEMVNRTPTLKGLHKASGVPLNI